MGKILNADFRKELYKNLVDAGYDKNEAQQIVGKKYYAELLEDVKHGVDSILSSLNKEDFAETFDFESINLKIDDLRNLKKIIE